MNSARRVIALGFFDGVHTGHGALLRRVTQRASQLHAVSAAFTFDTHPQQVISGQQPPLLSSCADRVHLMRHLYGIEDVIVAHYDQAMMRTGWETFLDNLVQTYGAVHLVAGHDFHFGYMGQGNPDRLVRRCRALGLGCDIIDPVIQDGILVSSTYIRTLIASGDMERARIFLGHPHCLTGTVIHGKQLGRTLGFPTINLSIPAGITLPACGVYATRITVDNCTYPAVTNVGVRPTVDDGDGLTVESFLLDFDGDLYAKYLQVEFYKFLRQEQKFPNLAALRQEIAHNAQQTRDYFNGVTI